MKKLVMVLGISIFNVTFSYCYKVNINNYTKRQLPLIYVTQTDEDKVVTVKPRHKQAFNSKMLQNLYINGSKTIVLDYEYPEVKSVDFNVTEDEYLGCWNVECIPKEKKH